MDEKAFWSEIKARSVDKLREYYGLNRRTFVEFVLIVAAIILVVLVDFRIRGLSSALEDFFVYVLYSVVVFALVFFGRLIWSRREAIFEWQDESLLTIVSLENALRPERIQSNVILTPIPREEGRYASIEVTNNNRQDIILYGMLDEIRNPAGQSIVQKLNPNKSKLTWAGGATEGRKTIEYDKSKYLNLTEIHGKGLHFLFNSWNEGFSQAEGEYEVKGELRGQMGERELQIPFCALIEFSNGRPLIIGECQN